MVTKTQQKNIQQDFPPQAIIIPPELPDEEEKKNEFYEKVYGEDETQREKRHLIESGAEALIAKAIEKNVSVETMERLLAMRRELKAEKAKELFDEAMAKFQNECPVILKDKQVKKENGGLLYSYAPIESIVSQVKELLQKHGFSYAIETFTEADKVRVVCVAKHFAGHVNPSSMELPLGTKTGIMSATQQVAAAITFAKRYAFCNAFGILTGDEDTDSRHETPPARPTAPVQRTYVPRVATNKSYLAQGLEKANSRTTGFVPIADQALMDGYRVTIMRLLTELGMDTDTKEHCADGVMLYAQLPLEEKYFAEIVNRLSAEIKTRQA